MNCSKDPSPLGTGKAPENLGREATYTTDVVKPDLHGQFLNIEV